jgi:hypothetical protein
LCLDAETKKFNVKTKRRVSEVKIRLDEAWIADIVQVADTAWIAAMERFMSQKTKAIEMLCVLIQHILHRKLS